jgi:hypothetical protein
MSYSRPHQAGTATARDTSSASRLLIGFREEHPIGKHSYRGDFRWRRDAGVHRPDRLNALSTPMMEGLLEALPRLVRDAAVGVIVPAWLGRE